jgi:Cys-rich protein (TIGR01571 family)
MSSETKYLVAEATPVDEAAKKNVGSWKSGLCDCFEYGIWHKALLCAVCFPSLLMGQLLTRMKMTWSGIPTSDTEGFKKTFRIVLVISICKYLIDTIFSCVEELPEDVDGEITMVLNEDCPSWKANLSTLTTLVFGLYILVVMIRLRMAIRQKYNIPRENCGMFEDFCCVYFCGCCSLVQMAKQTADYEKEEAFCLTTTGLTPSDGANEVLTQAIVV